MAIVLTERQCHELKTWPEFYAPITTGEKTFEIRKNDRDFGTGDYVWLREWCPTSKDYTGRSIVMRVGYVLMASNFPGLAEGYAAFSITRVATDTRDKVMLLLKSAAK